MRPRGLVRVRVRRRRVRVRVGFSLSLFFFFSLSLLLRITVLKITAPPLGSSPQGATVQRALRQSLHALQVPSTGCFEYTSLLCQHPILMSFVSPQRLFSNQLTRTLHDSLL